MSSLAESVANLASPWAYVIVGALAALEASAFVGLFVPGETALVVGGFVAYNGRASLVPMILAAFIGAVVGDSIGYEIGRHLGGPLRRSRAGQRIGEHRWQRAERYLREKGGRAVLLGRWVGILRALVPAIAGMARMPYRSFLPWNVFGAALWAPTFVLVGYAAGGSYHQVERTAGAASLILVGTILVIGGVVIGARWVARHPDEIRRSTERALGTHRAEQLRRVVELVGRRFRPGEAFGLSLTTGLVACVGLGWAFGAIVVDVLAAQGPVGADGRVSIYIAQHREPWVTSTFRVLTHLGAGATLVGIVLGVGLVLRRRDGRWTAVGLGLVAWAGSTVLSDVVKALVERPRPALALAVMTVRGSAFPSGHAAEATATLGAIAFVLSKRSRTWAVRVTAWAGALVVALLVGFSRVYLGVHWTSDVLAGWALGGLWLAVLLVVTPIALRRP